MAGITIMLVFKYGTYLSYVAGVCTIIVLLCCRTLFELVGAIVRIVVAMLVLVAEIARN